VLEQDSGRQPFGARWMVASPGLFRALAMPILAGRGFDGVRDVEDAPPVAIVNRSFAERHFDGRPLGRRLARAPVAPGDGTFDGPTWIEIVGVVPDTMMGAVGEGGGPGGDDGDDPAAVYLPSTQWPRPSMALVVTGRGAVPAADAIRRTLSDVDPAALGFDLRPFDSLLVRRRWLYDLFAIGFALFAGAAAVLGLGGVYGVARLVARQRRAEFGIRLALGARPRDLLRQVLRTSLGWVAPGLVVGLGLAAFGARLLGSRIHGVEAWDPWIFGLSTVLVLIAALAASLGPALRAARVDPVEALRCQ
jgi:putative ABC transport system permease protein